ncbi:hypothetical protein MCOR25_007433 [Pyricularia grisea]|nr:hypothetical protein MCOR25_007433 [Pyricularia grisea]
MRPNLGKQRTAAVDGELRATWLGHACYLVEFPSGLRVLFDPVMTDRCSPVSFLGPKRFTEAPCTISDIPIVDVVVISHNHYDHMSYPTIAEIQKHHPNVHFFAPLGNADWFRSCGITAMTELDWWREADVVIAGQSLDGAGISARLTCLPAQHNSGRTPFNTDRTLWASWAVESGGGKVFFAGDTGYRAIPHAVAAAAAEAARIAETEAQGKTEVDADFEDEYYDSHVDELPPACPAFAQIGKLHGPFALGLLPIGAYEPRGLMASIHASPADAVEIFRDTRCVRGLAMHWGTWVMGDEDVRDPPRRLRLALARKGMPAEGLFDVCKLGETVVVPVGPVGGQ